MFNSLQDDCKSHFRSAQERAVSLRTISIRNARNSRSSSEADELQGS